jgi:hypothetical protein
MNVYRKVRILLILLLEKELHLQLMLESGSIRMVEYLKLLMEQKLIFGRRLEMV